MLKIRTRSCQPLYFAAICAGSVNVTDAGGAGRKIPSQPPRVLSAGLAMAGSGIMPHFVNLLWLRRVKENSL